VGPATGARDQSIQRPAWSISFTGSTRRGHPIETSVA